MDITTTDNSVIIKDGVQTIAGNTGTFGYTYNTPADSVTITKDGKSVATGALSTSTVDGEALTPSNIDAKLKPIFITFSGGSGGGSSINVIDNLTSTSATDALSANQGKVLKDLIDSLPSGGGGVERKIINVTDTKLRLDPNYDLVYVWDFGNNVPFTPFTMTEDTATASLNTTNTATIIMVNRSSVASTMIVTLPKNLVWNSDADAKYYINVAKPAANTPTPDTQPTFSMGRNEMKVINIYGLGDKRAMELDF